MPKRTGVGSGRPSPTTARAAASRTYRPDPRSVRLVEWADADGYHADLELCPDPHCPVWLHGSGPRAPLVGRPHDEAARRAALEALLASIDEEDTEIYNRTCDLFEDPDEDR